MAKKGRPSTGRYDNVVEELNKYIDDTELPMIQEFCYKNYYDRSTLYKMAKNNEDLHHAIKRCVTKAEFEAGTGAMCGKYNATATIFFLKQLGWTDKVETKAEVEVSNNFIEALEKKAKENKGCDDVIET